MELSEPSSDDETYTRSWDAAAVVPDMVWHCQRQPIVVPMFADDCKDHRVTGNNKQALDAVWPQELMEMSVPDLNR
jgi:hypothetical protein